MAKSNLKEKKKLKQKNIEAVPTAKKSRPEPDEDEEERFCLSGSGKVVRGKKSVFAQGGDATLKSRIMHGDLDGEIGGYPEELTKEAINHAKDMWPHLFDEKGRPIISKGPNRPTKSKAKSKRDEDDED